MRGICFHRRTFIIPSNRRKDLSESWIVLRSESVFTSLVCESLRNNEIDVAVSTESLAFVLKYMTVCVFCCMRLSKRETDPVLRFELSFVDTGNCCVIHDIPAEVLRPDASWSEPILVDPGFHVSVGHSIPRLGACFDRLKHMGITDATLEIRREGALAKIELLFNSDSTSARLSLYNNSYSDVPSHFATESVTRVALTLSGVRFLLAKNALLGSGKCILMASENRYVSTVLPIQAEYGSIVAVSPAIISE